MIGVMVGGDYGMGKDVASGWAVASSDDGIVWQHFSKEEDGTG